MATRYAPYGWIIDQDVINVTDDSRAGTKGPRDISPEAEQALEKGEGVKFQMRDDDGEVYYRGRFYGDSRAIEAFGPLDDFGRPDAGCTSIEYLRDQSTSKPCVTCEGTGHVTKAWEVL